MSLQHLLLVVVFSAIPLSAADDVVFPEKTSQTIKGIGFEIQSDSIGSGNHGLPEEPHDLISSSHQRLSKEMLSCPFAAGLDSSAAHNART